MYLLAFHLYWLCFCYNIRNANVLAEWMFWSGVDSRVPKLSWYMLGMYKRSCLERGKFSLHQRSLSLPAYISLMMWKSETALQRSELWLKENELIFLFVLCMYSIWFVILLLGKHYKVQYCIIYLGYAAPSGYPQQPPPPQQQQQQQGWVGIAVTVSPPLKVW